VTPKFTTGEMKIEFVIDELVLHGFDPLQRYAIADLVEKELTRLARVHAADLIHRRPSDVARLDAGSFETPARLPGTHAGIGIANSVFYAVRGAAS
jgi:hypothetical protein